MISDDAIAALQDLTVPREGRGGIAEGRVTDEVEAQTVLGARI